jgi:CubicO group peptidase (beta-lactamase class C family)
MSQPTSSAQALDAAIDTALAEKRIVGGVVLVAKHGETVYRRAAGLADREAGQPMQEDAIFRLASITKPLLTAAAMRLVEDGVLALDRPVTDWLPDFRPRLPDGTAPTITLHHLLTHTSGLSYRFWEPAGSVYHQLNISDGLDQPGLPLAENLSRLAKAPLTFPPGTTWRYSLAIDVLGGVMEKAAGASLPDLVSRLVTRPLGLADTAFAVSDRSRLAAAYADGQPEPQLMTDGIVVPLWDGATIFAPSRVLDPASYPSGGAGMAGTADDILTFLEAIRRGGAPILKPETVATMMRNQLPAGVEQGPGFGFGYGWAVLTDPAAAASPQAKGTLRWGGVYGHNWFIDPTSEISVVALTNTAFEGMIGRFVTDVRDAVYR